MLRPFKRVLDRSIRAGIAPDGRRASIARVRRLDDGGLSLAAQVLNPAANDEDWTQSAALQANRLGLRRAPVSTVLASDAYQLQLLELPNVPPDELHAAIRWRIKDLVDYPVDQAVVDVFEMPRHANATSTPTGYAVVSRNDDVSQQIELMERADLRMDVIDIPELCIRNIAARLPQDEDGVAFLHLAEDCGYLTVTRQGLLYLIRRIDTGKRLLADAAGDGFSLQERISGISLDVQRALDHYESHFDCRPITEIVLGPGVAMDIVASSLAEQIGLTVNLFQLADLFRLEGELSLDDQGSCLLAVGAALRSDTWRQEAA